MLPWKEVILRQLVNLDMLERLKFWIQNVQTIFDGRLLYELINRFGLGLHQNYSEQMIISNLMTKMQFYVIQQVVHFFKER